MRTRKEIEQNAPDPKGWIDQTYMKLILEVLLDIRDNQEKKANG